MDSMQLTVLKTVNCDGVARKFLKPNRDKPYVVYIRCIKFIFYSYLYASCTRAVALAVGVIESVGQ